MISPVDALKKVGWDDAWADSFKVHASAGLSPARVAAREGSLYRLWTEGGDRDAAISGKYKLSLSKGGKLPAVGDWVAVDLKPTQGVIQGVLPRRTMVSRKEAGERDRMQVLVANVDVIFVVSGLDGDFNLRRLERYLAVVREGGSKGVVLLNKADLCPEAPQRLAETILIARDLPVHVISAKKGEGVDVLEQYLKPATTVALLGSSGAGKSTLVNRILGREKQATKETREDSRGRHTTTSREMFLTPGGAILLDTPGLREIQLADVAEGIRQTFSDIEALFGACKFDNCRHHKEPGCAVLAALDSGALDPNRWDSYLKLKAEQAVRGMKDWEKRRHDRKFGRMVHEALKRKGRKDSK
ncbi:ribosome small subunit-dependent GTPase A [bacterium]|nr:MAG: ribosome small subunit-dependent GTPase A [bacterium]